MLTNSYGVFEVILSLLQIELEEMSPAITKNKKRKAIEIEPSKIKDEQTAKAKKIDSGEREYGKYHCLFEFNDRNTLSLI